LIKRIKKKDDNDKDIDHHCRGQMKKNLDGTPKTEDLVPEITQKLKKKLAKKVEKVYKEEIANIEINTRQVDKEPSSDGGESQHECIKEWNDKMIPVQKECNRLLLK